MSNYSDIMDYAKEQTPVCERNDAISRRLFHEYGVNVGLRDENGKGILTGLTNISEVNSFTEKDGQRIPCDGELWYRGYRVETIINSLGPNEMGFEKAAYLLLMGEMPDDETLAEFKQVLSDARSLPKNFTRDVIMKGSSGDIMNSMMRSILTLASYDDHPLDTSVTNSLNQCIRLIAEFPLLATYSYVAYNHYTLGDSLYIHNPDPELSTAENVLRCLRWDKKFTPLEAKVLDTALILHMEHGGGNNSTFTDHVVTSAGSDTYSTITAAMASLKGPKHGGANIKVMEMMDDIRAHVEDPTDKDQIKDYLEKILDKEAFDHKGLIYGIGHAVYTISDPREVIFKQYVVDLAKDKGRDKDLQMYQNVEDLAPQLMNEKRNLLKPVSPNVDFYSGFVYDMLGIPQEMYTAMFAVARIVGWSAHRIEGLVTSDKIIRPAYMSVMRKKEWTDQ